MENESAELGIYFDGDALMVVGNDGDIERLVAHISAGRGLKGSSMTKDAAAAVAQLAGVVPQAGNGRWFQLTAESAARFRDLVAANQPDNGIMAGVLRGPQGKTGQHPEFVGGRPGPLLMSNVATMAMSLALQLAVEDLGKYLGAMDVKLDQLLHDGRAAAMDDASGITQVLSEAFDTYTQTGKVPPASWDKVRQHPALLASSVARCLEQVDAMAERASHGLIADRARTAGLLAREELPFWLCLLAVSLANQKRFHVLELGRVGQEHPEEAEIRRHVIAKHGAAEQQAVSLAIQRLGGALEQAGRVGDLERVFQPVSAAELVEAVNQAHGLLGRFAHFADLGPLAWKNATGKDWSRSVADVAQKGSNVVGGAVRGLFSGVRNAAEKAVLEQARRIMAEQAGRDAQPRPGEDGPGKDVPGKDVSGKDLGPGEPGRT